MRRYKINEEMYRRHFRVATKASDEAYRELAIRLQDLAQKWMHECTSMEQMMEKIVTEQLLNFMPEELQVWVGERKPVTAVEAGQLADNYVQVRRTAVDLSKEARRNPNE